MFPSFWQSTRVRTKKLQGPCLRNKGHVGSVRPGGRTIQMLAGGYLRGGVSQILRRDVYSFAMLMWQAHVVGWRGKQRVMMTWIVS